MSAPNFPIWSDFGQEHLTRHTQNLWDARLFQLEEYRRYFDGDIFSDRVPTESGSSEDAPFLYPVGINLVRMLALAQTDSMYGEWDDSPLRFEVANEDEVTESDKEAIALLDRIVLHSNPHTFWELELDRQVYGGCIVKIIPSLTKDKFVRWYRVPATNFFAIHDPDDPDLLLEAYVITRITREQARERYGYKTDEDFVLRVERWTKTEYENTLDGKRIDQFSGKNPFGVIPFTYIPRFRSSSWWGDSMTADTITAQNEINMRVADMGEAINYNAHPVRWGRDLPAGFDAKSYPIDPDAMWDLGRTVGGANPPEVGILEARTAVSPASFEYVKFLYDWTRTSNSTPPIAFGEDDGGGQRSGVTLEIRMWPLIKSVRRSRSYMAAGIRRAIDITAAILAQKQFTDVSAGTIAALKSGRITASFAQILPRDHQQAVDEVIKLVSTTPPMVSPETAQEILGRGIGELKRIEDYDWPQEANEDPTEGKSDEGSVPDGRASSVPGQQGNRSRPANRQ